MNRKRKDEDYEEVEIVKNSRSFSMRLNEQEMEVLEGLFKKSGHTGTLSSFVKQRVLDGKTISASMKQILEAELTLERALKYIAQMDEKFELYKGWIEIMDRKLKVQLEKISTLKP